MMAKIDDVQMKNATDAMFGARKSASGTSGKWQSRRFVLAALVTCVFLILILLHCLSVVYKSQPIFSDAILSTLIMVSASTAVGWGVQEVANKNSYRKNGGE